MNAVILVFFKIHEELCEEVTFYEYETDASLVDEIDSQEIKLTEKDSPFALNSTEDIMLFLGKLFP